MAGVPTMTPDAARARLVEALMATGVQDRAAFRTVYLLTSAKLFGICLRICHDRQAAEDVLHDVYVTVWQRASGFDPGRASPITWLSTIARNRSIDWRRSNARHPSEPLPATFDILDNSPSAIDLMLGDETLRRLRDCLAALEDRQRGAISQAFFDGVTYAELAARGDTPLGTVKSWVRRGLLSLKKCLDAGD